MRQAKILIDQQLAGILTENNEAYFFEYDKSYLKSNTKKVVSLTLPLQEEPFQAEYLFPFFDGLIPGVAHAATKSLFNRDLFV
tara:strand:+ start:554 stop:802 length:249 start_codon:yes stop_codon:yes gene_type:complete